MVMYEEKDESPAIEKMREPLITETGDVRAKNQITIPKRIAQAVGVEPGDRLIFVIDKCQPDQVRLYRLPKSFAGIAPLAYGGAEDAVAYVRAEREAWEE
jgi:AbrB family looped-hinge helix DNA binding protein